MEGDFIKINHWLTPLSWLYGLAIRLRNALFDMGILKSRAFAVPVIAVGNITVGGTGKTPHVEYLVRLLKDKVKVAVLSRGYKRKTRGFIIADDSATERSIGDEPLQMKRKFPDITVAVDRDRCHGICRLTGEGGGEKSDIDVILLDDAFQHRYVKPGINILLVDYHRLIIFDKLLPAGRLREPLSGKDRADIVIVTKCPEGLKPMEYRVITKNMSLYPYQHLFFTCLSYGSLEAVFGSEKRPLESVTRQTNVLLLTGIASPMQMEADLAAYTDKITPLTFGDHHRFTRSDISRINKVFGAMPQPRIIITTEKDTTRLRDVEGLSDQVREALFMLPIEIKFMLDQEERFNDNIIGYVRKNSRNSILSKREDDHGATNSHNTRHRTGTISFRNN